MTQRADEQMTRRERLEQRLAARRAWAEKAKARATARFAAADQISDLIPLGQPILVGHHSEGRARRAVGRIHGHMHAGLEATHLAERHEAAAAGIDRALERAIFSDDNDAVERLRERIAEKRANADRVKALNVAIRRERKRGGEDWLRRVGASPDELRQILENVRFGWRGQPEFPAYHLAGLRQSIRSDELRLVEIQKKGAAI